MKRLNHTLLSTEDSFHLLQSTEVHLYIHVAILKITFTHMLLSNKDSFSHVADLLKAAITHSLLSTEDCYFLHFVVY